MPIPGGEFLVGRADNAYVHVDDPSVSRNHARLLNSEEGLFVEDLGSANGTALRGAFLSTRTKIDLGDVLHIGSVPFRVDPEVGGPVETQPPPSSRHVNPARMSRATERIPPTGEMPWVPQAIPPDQLAAPVVSASDSDAEDLNAITLREPVAAAPATPPHPQPAAGMAPPVTPAPVPVKTTTFMPAPTLQRPVAPKTSSGRIWHLVIFLAGLGVGLLLGLVFAKIFFEMGGKPAGLP